jgi:hypothetical protein
MFKLLDKLANAGAGSRMPDEKRARARSQSQTTNARNELAAVATNPGAARVARKAAEAQLVGEVGEARAKELMAQADRRVRGSF